MPAHSFTPEEAAPLVYFANERHATYLRKAGRDGELVPDWACPNFGAIPVLRSGGLTDDPILAQYRFCNVFRELDRVTIWIREHIREPFADHEHLWFMLAIARFVNWPATLDELINCRTAWPSERPFYLSSMTAVMEGIRARGDKVETGAYMIRAESDPKKEWYSWSKQRYVAEVVLGRAWRQRAFLEAWFKLGDGRPSLQSTWEHLTSKERGFVGWGPFMVGQIVADLRHTRYLCDAPDVGRWAPLGPGSTRGLNRLAGRPLKAAVSQAQGLDEMLQLQELVNSATGPHVPLIELHDIQNCLCETDKYLRAKLGEGRPRTQYIPGRGS